MAKFSKGDKAVVIFCDCEDVDKGISVGDIVTIDESGSTVPFVILKNGHRTPLMDSQMKPYEEPPKEITLNGATYVLKEEQKPEHEWKFGDIAHERKTGDVVFVISWEPVSETVVVARKAYGDPDCPVLIPAKSLTFLRRADLSI